MLKKLLAWMVVLLIAALLAVPALAQDDGITASAGGMTANTASPTGAFTAADCPILQQDPAVWEMNLAMFPGLADLCP